tara:strand:- start:2680 stop:2856 length:177 start_codon:yes stop_codon:yes gene_type:complete
MNGIYIFFSSILKILLSGQENGNGMMKRRYFVNKAAVATAASPVLAWAVTGSVEKVLI